MARLIDPEGEVFEAPDESADHYLKLGARYAPPDEPGLEEPLLSPIDLLSGGGPLTGPVSATMRAGAGAMGRLGSAFQRSAVPVMRAGAQGAVKDIPIVRGAVKGIGEFLDKRGPSAAGSAASRVLRPAEQFGTNPVFEAGRALAQHKQALRAAASEAEEVGSAAARAKPIRPKAPKQGSAESRVAAGRGRPSQLEADLEKSLELERGMKGAKFKPREKELVRREMRVVKGGKAEAPKGSAESRVAAREPLKPEPLGPRHSVQKWSESKQRHITIENMPQPHLRASIRQYEADLAKLGKNAAQRAPVKHAVLEAMKKEFEYRASTSGVHIY